MLAHQHLQRRLGGAAGRGDLAAQFGSGSLAGRLNANLRGSQPLYRMSARLRGVAWMDGRWDGHGTIQTSGSGADLLKNLRMDGSFKARSVTLASDMAGPRLMGVMAAMMLGSGGKPRVLGTESGVVPDAMKRAAAQQLMG